MALVDNIERQFMVTSRLNLSRVFLFVMNAAGCSEAGQSATTGSVKMLVITKTVFYEKCVPLPCYYQ